jgi:hypothetical protein
VSFAHGGVSAGLAGSPLCGPGADAARLQREPLPDRKNQLYLINLIVNG